MSGLLCSPPPLVIAAARTGVLLNLPRQRLPVQCAQCHMCFVHEREISFGEAVKWKKSESQCGEGNNLNGYVKPLFKSDFTIFISMEVI